MKALITSEVTIDAKPNEVFAYLEDLKFHHSWNPPIQKIEPIIKLELGAKYQSSSMFLGKRLTTDNVVTVFVEGQEIQIENTTGLVEFSANYRVSASGNKTIVNSRIAVASKSKAFAFTTPVLKALAQRELNTDLQALKVAVEQKLS